jgi:mannose-6-phosphate isomerase-like protein (cupin superfamily)
MSQIFAENIELITNKNNDYRNVVYTTSDKNFQLVLMSLKPDQEIGMEKHDNTTQFIRIESGKGIAYINDKQYQLTDGSAVVIPSNTWHNIKNIGNSDLKLYTIYTPAEHPDKLIESEKNNSQYNDKYIKYKNKFMSIFNS